MSKDYSKLKNIKTEFYDNFIDEKEIEEKYNEFLDWFKNDIEEKESNYDTINSSSPKIIPISFKDLLFKTIAIQGEKTYIYSLNNDIQKYLDLRMIKIDFHFKNSANTHNQNEFISYKLSCPNLDYYIHKNILKIPNLEQQISELKQTNEEILNKLQEQIKLNEEFSKLNNKLCERIFEMKEEKFKNEKIDL